MGLKNNGMCLHCRSRSHSTSNCDGMVRCPKCKIGWRQCFMVEKESSLYKGSLFYTCTMKIMQRCDYWILIGPPSKGQPDYVEEEPICKDEDQEEELNYFNSEEPTYVEGESSEDVDEFTKQNSMEKLSALMEKCADISKKKNVGVSLRLYEFEFVKKA